MNSIEMLLTKPIFQALGWALVHFLWQGTIVAILYAVLAAALRRRSANVRYSMACGAMLLMLAFPLATIYLLAQPSSQSLEGKSIGSQRLRSEISQPSARATLLSEAHELSLSGETLKSNDAASSTSSSSFWVWAKQRFADFLPWLVAIWFAGVLFLSLRFLGGLFVAQRLKRKETSRALHYWQQKLVALCERLRVSSPVRLCESALVEVPTVIGWLRPVILIPTSALTGLSPEQLEALLAHELGHIKRYDYLINLAQTAVETLLFYHPAVWWLSSQIRQEREHCCDDLAVETCGNVLIYARALAELERLRAVSPQLAVAANGGKLINRIQRLIGSPTRTSHRFESGIAGFIAIATVFGILAGAQAKIHSDEKREASDNSSMAASVLDKRAGISAGSARRDKLADQKATDVTRDTLLEAEAANAEEAQDNETPASPEADETVGLAQTVQESGSTGSGDFIADLSALGYTKLSVDDLVGLKTHGVTVEFIKAMNSLFNQKLSVDELVEMRVHGVTERFMSEIKALGYANLSVDNYIAFRVHGVTPEYVSEWKNAGYANLSADDLTEFKIHAVTPAFAQEMKALGLSGLDADELTAFKIHGVTAQFAQTMKSYIRERLSAEDLTAMRIHGVTPEFIKELEALGLTNLSAEDLTGFRIHGVTSNYIKAIHSLGYKPSADDLVGLKVHGVTAEFIEMVKSRGFTDATLEQLIELRRLNIIPGSRKK